MQWYGKLCRVASLVETQKQFENRTACGDSGNSGNKGRKGEWDLIEVQVSEQVSEVGMVVGDPGGG